MATITVSASQGETTVEARAGDELVLELPENPTSGYRWQVERTEGPLQQVDDTFLPAAEGQFGAGGVRELRFRVGDDGTGRIGLKHWQEWSGEESVTQRATVSVTVTALI